MGIRSTASKSTPGKSAGPKSSAPKSTGRLTTKELSAIKDQLGAEDNLIKKVKMYSQNTQDMVLRQRYDDVAARHQKHMKTLISHLN